MTMTGMIEAYFWSAPITASFIVLMLSFLVALLAGLIVDASFKKGLPDKVKPDVDAYIDQMIAGNGTHLERKPKPLA
jgi:hypothetical protein